MKDLNFLKNMILSKFEDGIKTVFEELKKDALFFEYNNEEKTAFFDKETNKELVQIMNAIKKGA